MRLALAVTLATLLSAAFVAPAGASTGCMFNSADSADGDVLYLSSPARDGLVMASGLSVSGTMKCSSARYVVQRFLRPQWRRHGHFNRTFWDGYVLWHGSQTNSSLAATTITFRENQTGTSFRLQLHAV